MVFGLLNGWVAAQTPQAPPATEPFEPTVGQAGKDVVWVPTPPELVEKMLDMAKVTPQDFVMDLGSGDGRNIIAAAKRGATRRSASNSTPTWSSSRARRPPAAGVGGQGDIHRRRHVRGRHLEGHGARAVPASRQSQQAHAEVPGAASRARASSAIPSRRKAGRPTKPRRRGECVSWCTSLLWIVPANVEGTWKLPHGRADAEAGVSDGVGDADAAGPRRR